MKQKIILFLLLTYSAQIFAEASDYFQRQTQELGISNIGVGYSNVFGFQFHANARYQYFVLDRVAVGGSAFYDNFQRQEWMGIGPVASFIFWSYGNWFSRLDQALTVARYSGLGRDPSELYATTALGLNYIPDGTNYFIGASFAHSYALDNRQVLRPNIFQLMAGWFWN